MSIQQASSFEGSTLSLSREIEPPGLQSHTEPNSQPQCLDQTEFQPHNTNQPFPSGQANNDSQNLTATVVSQLLSSSKGSLQVHALAKAATNTHPSGVLENLNSHARQLIGVNLPNTTKASHKRSWDMFALEFPRINALTITVTVLSNFIAQVFFHRLFSQ